MPKRAGYLEKSKIKKIKKFQPERPSINKTQTEAHLENSRHTLVTFTICRGRTDGRRGGGESWRPPSFKGRRKERRREVQPWVLSLADGLTGRHVWGPHTISLCGGRPRQHRQGGPTQQAPPGLLPCLCLSAAHPR